MPHPAKMDHYHGTGRRELAFSDLDLKYRLKHSAFIEICMPPMFEELERKFRMFALRQKGIVPIMFYLDFQAAPVPLAFGRDVETEYEVGVYRTLADERAGAPPRLLLDLRTVIQAHRGSGTSANRPRSAG